MNLSMSIQEIRARINEPIITRFAPSPTGYLHLGHVVNAIYVWGIAAKLDGKVLLRMEDHDRGRFRPEYEESILEDLEWLGFTPQVNTTESFRSGATHFRQSDNQDSYRESLSALKQQYRVYACTCSRRQIVERTGRQQGELCYDGNCREKGIPFKSGTQLRLEWKGKEEVFKDLRMGTQSQNPDLQCGDLQLIDKQGQWSYQFAVTVDDWKQGVNLVIRGEDILSSSGRQLRLARMLGRTQPPLFLHHPLLYEKNGEKLSKRQLSEGIIQSRKTGIAPEKIIGQAAYGCGLISQPQPIPASEVASLFE